MGPLNQHGGSLQLPMAMFSSSLLHGGAPDVVGRSEGNPQREGRLSGERRGSLAVFLPGTCYKPGLCRFMSQLVPLKVLALIKAEFLLFVIKGVID